MHSFRTHQCDECLLYILIKVYLLYIMDLLNIIIEISVPLVIGFIIKIFCKFSCFQGLGAIGGPYAKSNSYSLKKKCNFNNDTPLPRLP